MNTLMNMDPWGFLDDLLGAGGRTFRNIRARAAGRFPPVNVYLDDDAAIVDVELPGRSAKDVDLTLEAQSVTIADKPEEGKARAWSRRLELPFHVDVEKANAKFTDGVLRVELPKAEAPGTHRIAIH